MTKTWLSSQELTIGEPARRRRWFSYRWRRISTSRKTIPLYFILVAATIYRAAGFMHEAHKQSSGLFTEKYVGAGHGFGGRWHIPPSWLEAADSQLPNSQLAANVSIIDAAEHALSLVLHHGLYLNNTRIPRIVHQTWRTLDARLWSPVVRGSVEEWLRVAHGDEAHQLGEMAWFLWDDDGIDALVDRYETRSSPDIHLLPYPVELADVFRVVVVKWFGGVYADVDTMPLKHPDLWVADHDLLPWTDSTSGVTHMLDGSERLTYKIPEGAPTSYDNMFSSNSRKNAKQISLSPPVNAIFGIEADNPPEPDPLYWRMGYSFPVQLTNWAFAMAPHHPVASQFLSNLVTSITRYRIDLHAIDPLDITGPPALTVAVQEIARRHDPEFLWDGLSGRTEAPGGRSKAVGGDVLVLPITGFSPGRGWLRRMGSEAFDHPNARLRHIAAGSWRKPDMKVEAGKLCRVLFGLCRDWKKIPDR